MSPRSDKLNFSHIQNVDNPYGARDFSALIAVCLPLTTALNALNSSMGKDDAYPVALSMPAIAELAFVDDLIAHAPRGARDQAR